MAQVLQCGRLTSQEITAGTHPDATIISGHSKGLQTIPLRHEAQAPIRSAGNPSCCQLIWNLEVILTNDTGDTVLVWHPGV